MAQVLHVDGKINMTDRGGCEILDLGIWTVGENYKAVIVLQVWLGDIDCLLPLPLRRDCDERPQINLPVTQRTLRAARMPNPLEPYAAVLRDIAN
jgi:hypothetical protein